MTPRIARELVPGGIYQVISRGVERRRTFVDHEDYALYTRLLATAAIDFGWNVLVFCLMPNHVHLLIETPEPNLSKGMHWIHTLYVRAFNDRHERVGPLFQDRPKMILIRDDAALIRTVGYIVMNPVAAVLAERPQDWPWGSHAALAEVTDPQPWVAHSRLESLLEEITGTRCYFQLIATEERQRHERDPY